MKRLLGLIVGLMVLPACGAEPLCEAHGVVFMGVEGSHGQEMPPDWSCAKFSRAIEVVIEMFDRLRPQPGFERESFKKSLQGYSVNIRLEDNWYSPEHKTQIAGYTRCWTKYVLLNQRPPEGADTLAHELAHVAQGCEPGDHSDWNQPNKQNISVNMTVYQTYHEIVKALESL